MLEVSIRSQTSQVSDLTRALTRNVSQGFENLRRAFGVVPVAGRELRTANRDFTHLPSGYVTSIVREDANLDAIAWSPNRNNLVRREPSIPRNPVHGDVSRLRGGVGVDELSVRKVPAGELDVVRCDPFTADSNQPQVRVVDPVVEVLGQASKERHA